MHLRKDRVLSHLNARLTAAKNTAEKGAKSHHVSEMRWVKAEIARLQNKLDKLMKKGPVPASNYTSRIERIISLIEMIEGDVVNIGSVPDLKHLLTKEN